MGTLIAMHYPTVLALGAADHTYVKCGTGGKAWSCWGGKTGGNPLRSGSGSTKQADAIAEPNERGGITCYLINGVCHQAANRILFPAGIFVTGARGYGLSAAIFGPYGRPRGPFGMCQAPFNRHTGVTGDLPECAGPSMFAQTTAATQPPQERIYFDRVSAAYSEVAQLGMQVEDLERNRLVEFMATLFGHKIDYSLQGRLERERLGKLRDLHVWTERARIELENQFAEKRMKGREFVAASEEQVNAFQENAAAILHPDEYHALFDLKRGERITLADPDIVKQAYPD
jgi:hypothetical protein